MSNEWKESYDYLSHNCRLQGRLLRNEEIGRVLLEDSWECCYVETTKNI